MKFWFKWEFIFNDSKAIIWELAERFIAFASTSSVDGLRGGGGNFHTETRDEVVDSSLKKMLKIGEFRESQPNE